MRLIFFIILFGVGYLLYHLYGKKLLKQGPANLIKPALILLGIILIFGVLTGRGNAIMAAIGALLVSVTRFAPLIFRFYPQIRDLLKKFGVSPPGGPGTSRVKTATLSMTLEHQTGRIDGEIFAGQYKGRLLSSLTTDEIKSYYQTCKQQDPQALRLIEAFVQREFPELWQSGEWTGSQQQDNSSPPQNDGDMSVDEARNILGIAAGASKQEISYAHRKLMAKLHPDKGGSTYLATRVNQAKDLLIAQLKQE